MSAAVAVLEINIEKIPVMNKNPNKTFSLFLPKGRIMLRAKSVSNPDLEAAIARIKPAKNNIIIGSANEAMIAFDFKSSPIPSPLNIVNEFSETVTHIIIMIASDVAHAGMHSVSHAKVAKTKIAIMRCCTIVKPSIPKNVIGRFQTPIVIKAIAKRCHTFFISMVDDSTFKLFSDMVHNV